MDECLCTLVTKIMFKKMPQNSLDFKDNKAEFQRKILYVLKAIMEKPKWLTVFILGRFPLIRFVYTQLSQRSCNYPETSNTNIDSLFSNLDTTKVLKILKKDSVFVGLWLPENILKELQNYVKSHDCFAGGRVNLGFNISEKDKVDKIYKKPFYVARYFNVSRCCPAISKLVNDQKIRQIANQYIGTTAKYVGASLYWTFPIQGNPYDSDQQQFSYFHYDLDDYSSLRFCFYLSDVTVNSGPHICIRGSHTKKSIFHILNYFTRIQSEQKLVKFYGEEKLTWLIGKAGFGFIEDTFCFHKGMVPKSQPRLFLQLHFAANNYNRLEYHDDRTPNTLKSFKKL